MANKAKIVIVNAIDGSNLSAPFKLYLTEGSDKPAKGKKFVLRLDDGVSRDGDTVVRVNNSELGLIASHNPEWLDTVLTGYRSMKDEVTYIVAQILVDDVASISSLSKLEKF
jgi:hypothetical protein